MNHYRWYHKVFGVLYVIVCFLIGLFLLCFPWSESWKPSTLSNFSPEWGMFWMNPYFRGGVSGIGMINIYFSVVEAFRLQRFSASHDEDDADEEEEKENTRV